MKISFTKIILILLLVNISGISLKYFELERYIIIIGFRFHLSFLLPLILIINKITFDDIKTIIIPKSRFNFITLSFLFISIILLISSLYFFDYIKIGDPEYFYEFGLSSIFDFPVYLLWNLPQFLFLFIFISISLKEKKYKFLIGLFIICLLFLYEFISVDPLTINLQGVLVGLSFIIILNLLIFFYQNFYFVSFSIFTLLWSNFLLWGSESKTVINILFAARYSEWEGFFIVNKAVSDYVFFIIPLSAIILLSVTAFFNKKKR